MRKLDPENVRWIFVHTAAYRGSAGAAKIRDWHTSPDARDPSKPWDDIGYHFVVCRDGGLETGRSTDFAGAHVQGCNSRSIGICCEGHGDHQEHTEEQRRTLLGLCHNLIVRYGLGPADVLGHREVNQLVDDGVVADRYRTRKTCPGDLVDMDEIRAHLSVPAELPEPRVRLEDVLDVSERV